MPNWDAPITTLSRTAYPQFKANPSAKELLEFYTPSKSELEFIQSHVKSQKGFLAFILMLKSFQRLGYFIVLEKIPQEIVVYIRKCLKIKDFINPKISLRSQRYYQQIIRDYLKINPYGKQAQKIIAIAVSKATLVMEYSADLINVAIEELVKERGASQLGMSIKTHS